MKIAIVIGHNAKAQGAVRCTDGRTEFDCNGELAELIRSHDKSNGRIFKRITGGGYSAEIGRVYSASDSWGADCTFELHFNCSVNPAANGCLMLSSGTRGSMALAEAMQAHCVAVLGNADRGVRIIGRRDRGGRSLWQGRAPAVLIEPYFGSNPAECLTAEQHKDELAEAIYRAALSLKVSA